MTTRMDILFQDNDVYEFKDDVQPKGLSLVTTKDLVEILFGMNARVNELEKKVYELESSLDGLFRRRR